MSAKHTPWAAVYDEDRRHWLIVPPTYPDDVPVAVVGEIFMWDTDEDYDSRGPRDVFAPGVIGEVERSDLMRDIRRGADEEEAFAAKLIAAAPALADALEKILRFTDDHEAERVAREALRAAGRLP